MVKDIRKLTFTSEELISAFEAYARTTPNFMPGGKIMSCTPIDQDGVELKIEMEYGSSTHEIKFTYRGLDVLRPLILFCIENNVMLPRDGRKALSIEEGRATVLIELNLDVELSTVVFPMLGEHVRLIRSNPASTKSQ